jgi:hypothetical protein
MTDKVQKIREEVIRMHNLLPITNGDNISVNYADRICTTLEMYIDSLQEEPVSEGRDIFDNCLKSEEKFILPQKISGNINCENCLYSSACALGDIQSCIIDKPISEELEKAAIDFSNNLDNIYGSIGEQTRNAFKAGAKWKKKQMLKNAISAELYSDGMFTPLIGVKDKEKLNDIKFGDKVKLIIIKDE